MKSVLIGIVRSCLNLIYMILKLFPVKDKVVFISRQGNGPSLDFRMLADEIKREHPEYRMVFLCRMLNKSVSGAIGYIPELFRQMYHLATSRAAILDSYCIAVSLLHHRKSLLVIQMWHSVGTMKKFGYSILDQPEGSSSTTARAMRMHRGYSYALASSEAYKAHLAEGFDLDISKIVTLPLPRVELLQDEGYVSETREKIRLAYPETEGRKVIVYVPTFRMYETEKDKDALKALMDEAEKRGYTLVIKAHPLREHVSRSGADAEPEAVEKAGSAIFDDRFSSMEMLTVADYVVTDYSCILYEAALLDKPLYFYVYDLDDYTGSRDMYIDYMKEMPGPVCKDAVSLLESIGRDDYDMDRLRAFCDKYVKTTGHETRDIAEFIFSEIDRF